MQRGERMIEIVGGRAYVQTVPTELMKRVLLGPTDPRDPSGDLLWQAFPSPLEMAAQKFLIYDSFKEYAGDGTIDLDTDTIKMALFLSTSNCATLTHDEYGDLTNEHANGNGYTTGGVTLPNIAWTRSGAKTVFTSDPAEWTASGGAITARFAVLYDNVTRSGITNPLLAYSLLDDTPADHSAADGNIFRVTPDATNGWFYVSGGDT